MNRFVRVACAVLFVLGVWTNVTAGEEIDIQVSPSTINLAQNGECVTVHADIPLRGVVTASLELNGVEVWYTKADARGDLVAKFDVDSVKDILSTPSADLRLVGVVETLEGGEVPFSGTDTVRVVDNGGKKK